jgi:phospholipase D1/2
MISGWYISPEFQLVRPVSLNPEMRLEQLLKRACERGLKVFVLVYNESSFLTNDSAYVKQTLEALSPAIKVLQHPLGVLPSFWSHHEKLVIIDQSEAFLGGLDLGFGRFDDSRHLIDHNDPDFYPGIEYNNVRNTDLTRVREFWRDGVPRDVARLPWHDVGVYLAGEAALDLSHHFIEYWNYASFQTFHQDRYVLVLNLDQPKKPFLHQIQEGIAHKFKGIRQFAGALKRRIFSPPEENEAESESAKAAKAVREEEVRVAVEGTSECRSNQAGKWGAKFDESWYETGFPLPTVPVDSSSKSQESEVARREGSALQLRRRFASMKELDEIVETMEDRIGNIDFMDDLQVTRQRNELPEIREEAEDDFSCQILRSVGSWSIGCEPRNKEQSVHSAYLHLIRTARRFIYIENQFFISMTEGSGNSIKNEIANEIYLRIATAVAHHEPFKVWVIIPLIPGFAGELDDPDAVIPRVIMHWQFATISRGDHSLMARVAALGVNPADYLQFFGLRAHGMVGGRPQTEIVYVHSKLLIADDQRAICGSANINERSMRGSRDSEVCLLVEDGPQQLVRGVAVSEELFSLRLRLFHEHFGSDLDASDPAGELLWQQVRERIAKNTALYREIFKCYPDDYIKTLADITILRDAPPPNQEIYERWKD